MEKWANAKSVIKLKASITIQVRVTGGGYSWASCNPYIQLVALKQTARRSRCPNSYVHLGREGKTHPSTKVSDSMHHGCVCMEKTECDERAHNQSRESPGVDSRGCPPCPPQEDESVFLYRRFLSARLYLEKSSNKTVLRCNRH